MSEVVGNNNKQGVHPVFIILAVFAVIWAVTVVVNTDYGHMYKVMFSGETDAVSPVSAGHMVGFLFSVVILAFASLIMLALLGWFLERTIGFFFGETKEEDLPLDQGVFENLERLVSHSDFEKALVMLNRDGNTTDLYYKTRDLLDELKNKRNLLENLLEENYPVSGAIYNRLQKVFSRLEQEYFNNMRTYIENHLKIPVNSKDVLALTNLGTLFDREQRKKRKQQTAYHVSILRAVNKANEDLLLKLSNLNLAILSTNFETVEDVNSNPVIRELEYIFGIDEPK